MSSKQEREMKRQEKARLDDMADVISTDQGKRVIWGILEICGVSSKNMNIIPELTARQEGARSAGLDIQTWATMSAPHHVMKMIQDNGEKIGLLVQEEEDEQD